MNIKLTLKLTLLLASIFYLLDVLVVLLFYSDELPPVQGFVVKALESLLFGVVMAFAYQLFYRKKIEVVCGACSEKQSRYVFPKNWFYTPEKEFKCKNCNAVINLEGME